jgi:protein-S-isoprenylcysteine O-methyltransferase Ste14
VSGGLDLKVPPPAVAVFMAAVMWLGSRYAPAFGFHLPARDGIAAAFFLAGILSSVSGVASIKRARTTLNPMKPDSATTLVNSGIYRFTRNPMYLGLLLLLLGWAIHLSNVIALVVAAGFILYMNRFQIAPEERALASRFGPQFTAYASKVRRWL